MRKPQPHFVVLSSRKDHIGKPIRAAYEDVRQAPSSSLLTELDGMDFVFPRSNSVIDEDFEEGIFPPTSAPPLLFEELEDTHDVGRNLPPTGLDVPHVRVEAPSEAINPDLEPPSNPSELSELGQEEALWASHPKSESLLASLKSTILNNPLLDINTKSVDRCNSLFGTRYPVPTLSKSLDLNATHEAAQPEKDIGENLVVAPSELPFHLASSKQKVLQQIQSVVGNKPTSKFKIQFVPQWIVDQAIAEEKENYDRAEAYKEVSYGKLPRNANVISSHHFFQVKTDGEGGKLKIICRLVPHGNRDRDNEFVRKDSATAQFPIIRIVISLAAIMSFSIASIGINGAYLQAGQCPRDIYVKPPKGWASNARTVWKILKLAYGIVESGRLWQLVAEEWMSTQGFVQFPGLLQLFVTYNPNGSINLLIEKVVDDFLVVGVPPLIHQFHEAISRRFIVGRYVVNKDLVFNRLHIHQQPCSSISVNMQEYVDKTLPVEVSNERRRQHQDEFSAL